MLAKCKMFDVNYNDANVDLKYLQIIGRTFHNPSCDESAHSNSCNKLKKESSDHNGENKERHLTKTMLADKIKTVMVVMIMIQMAVTLRCTTTIKIRALS